MIPTDAKLPPKERRRLEELRRQSDAIAVSAVVTIQAADGTSRTASAKLWDALPAWWCQAYPDQRQAWVASYFGRYCRLQPGERVIGARATIAP